MSTIQQPQQPQRGMTSIGQILAELLPTLEPKPTPEAGKR